MTSAAIVPHTGEVLDVGSMGLGDVARTVAEIDEMISRLRECRSTLSERAVTLLDADRLWTAHAEGYKLSAKSDAPVAVWDAEKLGWTLDEMVLREEITPEARDRALQTRIEYKPMAAGLNALLKSPALAERIEACREMVPPNDRRVKVERA